MEKFIEENKWIIGLVLAGIILIGLGVLGFKIFDFNSSQPKVEILGETEVGSGKLEAGNEMGNGTMDRVKITVEAAGEVIKPGVYEMAIDSRVNDLLIIAGGLSVEADREWVSKNINLAQKLSDGVKIFVPSKNEMGSAKLEKINVNTASEAELDTLWGVGEATAKKIIESRPYQKPEELLQKKIVKSNVWEAIKDKISVY